MDIRFDNKIVIVTGGSNGIGKATILEFQTAGATTICLDIKKPNFNTDNEICDISNREAVQTAIQNIINKHQDIHVLVNNAGIQTYGTVTETSEETWDNTLNINLKGYFLCCKYAIPYLLKVIDPVIINISSVNGVGSTPNAAAYVASKAGIIGLTKSIAVDYAPQLRCVAICPAAVDTPMMQYEIDQLPTTAEKEKYMNDINSIHLLNRVAKAEEIANMTLFLASNKASFTNGHYFRVDGGLGIKI